MKRSLSSDMTSGLLKDLAVANKRYADAYPGDPSDRQPVHTVYGGAHLFKAETAGRLGEGALANLEAYAPNFVVFAQALGLPGAYQLPTEKRAIEALVEQLQRSGKKMEEEQGEAWLAYTVYNRVIEKLKREAVEDFRIDFEDGYGNRLDEEEDEVAAFSAKEVARGMKLGNLPPFIGIRIKTPSSELVYRSIRTLDIFVSTLVEASGGKLPANFVVTLPKVTIPEHVTIYVRLFEQLEEKLGLAAGSLKLELMIEMPQTIMGVNGESMLPKLLRAAEGRCVAAHFGVYDHTAACNITADHQLMRHPTCDFARLMMQVAYSGTGIFLSDGATNIMPVGPHRGTDLTPEQEEENRTVVHRAWKWSYNDIQHSLHTGYYQGWDLHPAQLVVRYAAVYTFFLESFATASLRLKTFMGKAAQATLVGDVFDDAATGQALLNYFLRGINCGAITEEEALATGLTIEEIQSRSFVQILNNRRAAK